MFNKSFLIFFIVMFVASAAFVQADDPKNSITIDFGPTIVGGIFAGIKVETDINEDSIETHGFGIGIQYERRIIEHLSLVGRFSILNIGMGMTFREDGLSASAGTDFTSFSFQAHARFYPFVEGLFFDGAIGYAMLITSVSGKAIFVENGERSVEKISFSATRGYFKYGGLIGYHFNFGRSGGFVFEPAVGWYSSIGFGETFGKRMHKKLDNIDIDEFDENFEVMESIIFIGGPRVVIAFGYSF